jgi:hypothetical protein
MGASSKLSRFIVIVLILSAAPFVPVGSHAQAPSRTQPKKPKKKPVAPQSQQPDPNHERGLRLLKAAEAETAGLQPDMRAYVLWRASYGYATTDPKIAAKISRDAFTASQDIQDPDSSSACGGPLGSAGDIKGWIQERVLLDMIHKDNVPDVQARLPYAETAVRNRITAELVRYYIDKKQLPRAQDLLSQLADADDYPFNAAADLLLASGPEYSGDRMTIFNQALSNFDQHPNEQAFKSEDIGTFIERTWDHVPPGLALEAVDKVLDAAKSQPSSAHFSMTSEKGSVALNSTYQLRLFQLLPVLEQLDKDRADALLRDNAELQAQLQKYPKGMQSLNSDQTFFSYGMSDSATPPEGGTLQQANAQMRQRVFDSIRDAEKDPALALSEALGLPVESPGFVPSPRAQALMQIASQTGKKKPALTKSALDELVKIEDQLTPEQMRDVARFPELYLVLGDEEGAKKALKAMLKAADKVYAQDTNSDDPNKAFKGVWPSVDMWRQCVQVAGRISPDLAEEIIANIPDPDIVALEKVAFASALLHAPGVPNLVNDCRKKQTLFTVSD